MNDDDLTDDQRKERRAGVAAYQALEPISEGINFAAHWDAMFKAVVQGLGVPPHLFEATP